MDYHRNLIIVRDIFINLMILLPSLFEFFGGPCAVCFLYSCFSKFRPSMQYFKRILSNRDPIHWDAYLQS